MNSYSNPGHKTSRNWCKPRKWCSISSAICWFSSECLTTICYTLLPCIYFSHVIKNTTESDCAAYAILHESNTIDFFAILEDECYLGALDPSNTTPLFPDDTTLDSIRILKGNIMFWIIQVSTGSSMTKCQNLN